jgi:hypothetical protein
MTTYNFISFKGKLHSFQNIEDYTKAVLSDHPEPIKWVSRPSFSVSQRHEACLLTNSAQSKIKNLNKYNIDIPSDLYQQSIPSQDCWS